ncbi:MAG: lamin tail domain-containing protein, partial [Planctomycetales bacterium]|nr:lamin tail domain-containing protein [Planctomycetales bacterium]
MMNSKLDTVRRRKSRPSRRLCLAETLEPRIVLDSSVVFNEIMYHPLGDETTEFVELHNQHAINLDISQWKLGGGIDYQFPEGTAIPGGGYVVVARDPAAFSAASGFTSAYGPFTGQLSNSGEQLELRDRSDRLMDEISYGDGERWSFAADGTGPSLSKLDPNQTSDDATFWDSSRIVGGTPGRRNFPDVHTENESVDLVGATSEWRYHATGSLPAANWFTDTYNDSSWNSGPGIFFAGDATLGGPATEVVSGVVAIPSSNLAGFDRVAAHAVDGSGLVGDTHVISPDGTMWLNQGSFSGGPADLAPEITFDLGSVRSIDHMRFWNYNETLTGRPELLGRGISSADIFVAGADGVFTLLEANHEFAKAPGTQTDFSEIVDFGGVEARFVKLDIHGNHGGDNNFVGISEVQFI